MATKIKLLALANGDSYQHCKVDKTVNELLDAIKEREFINVCCGKQEVLINSEFIISIEL